MGQEASLPTDVVDDLDEQARAPPSSTNPPPVGAVPTSSTGNSNNSSSSGTSKRPGKMIGAMFHRGQQQQQQNQHAAEHFESRETARAAASGRNLYLNDGGSEKFYNNNGSGNGVAQQQQPQVPNSPPPPPPNYPHQAQSQSQHPNDVNYSNNNINADARPIVSVMYEGKSPSKKGLSRAGARGAALISSMRNLSLGGALRGGKSQSQKTSVNDWEKQWDEDEDDSDGEQEDETATMQHEQQQHAAAAVAASALPLHQIRPGMDAGHSSVATASFDQQQYMGQVSSPTTSPAVSPQKAAPQFVTPDMYSQGGGMPQAPLSPVVVASSSSAAAAAAANSGVQTGDLLHEPAIVVDENGMEQWDLTGTASGGARVTDNLSPNVQMFLPMLRVLGKGSFGKVVLVQKRIGKERGQLFAMKILRKTHLVKRRQIERTRTERKVLSVVNHPFIMKLHYAFQSHDKLYLVLDYCPGGELFFHLSRFRRFPERVARFYAAELLLAIGHLHKRGIIYRDLKPENVLLDADGHVKLGDFGLAKAGIRHPFEGAVSMCGTPEYMAPEVLSQQGHGFCVDYWGLGMLVYEMMTGLPPWYTTDRAKLFRRLKSAPLDIPSYFSVQSANCVSALLERNPSRRLGVTGIRTAMEHEFFRNISWRSLYARRVEAPIRPCEGWSAPEGTKEDLLDMDNGSTNESGSDIEKMGSLELEAATANFDNTFTRMPVESEDQGHGGQDDEGEEELNEHTFVGFTFDGKEPGTGTAASSRQRTQNNFAPNLE